MADAEPLVDTLETHIENTREQNAEAVGFLMRWNFLNQALIPNAPGEDDEDVIEDAPEVHPLLDKMVELANETNYLLRKSVLVNDGVGFPQFDFITRDEDYDTMRDRAILLNTTMEEILGDLIFKEFPLCSSFVKKLSRRSPTKAIPKMDLILRNDSS